MLRVCDRVLSSWYLVSPDDEVWVKVELKWSDDLKLLKEKKKHLALRYWLVVFVHFVSSTSFNALKPDGVCHTEHCCSISCHKCSDLA